MRADYIIHLAVWQGITLEVCYCPKWGAHFDGMGFAHLEIRSENCAVLPITETGYKSHFLPATEIDDQGGPVAYVEAWLDHAAQSAEWKEHVRQSRQLSLF